MSITGSVGRGRSSVVRVSEIKSDEPGFDPLAFHGEGQFFCPSESALVQTWLCLASLRVYDTYPHFSAR